MNLPSFVEKLVLVPPPMFGGPKSEGALKMRIAYLFDRSISSKLYPRFLPLRCNVNEFKVQNSARSNFRTFWNVLGGPIVVYRGTSFMRIEKLHRHAQAHRSKGACG